MHSAVTSQCKWSTSPWVWQLQAKLKCPTWPICKRVEEHLIGCGDFFIFGGGVALFLNFHMSLVGMNVGFLIAVHPILSNICVLTAFLPNRMNLDQHRHVSFGGGALGCWDMDNSVFREPTWGFAKLVSRKQQMIHISMSLAVASKTQMSNLTCSQCGWRIFNLMWRLFHFWWWCGLAP